MNRQPRGMVLRGTVGAVVLLFLPSSSAFHAARDGAGANLLAGAARERDRRRIRASASLARRPRHAPAGDVPARSAVGPGPVPRAGFDPPRAGRRRRDRPAPPLRRSVCGTDFVVRRGSITCFVFATHTHSAPDTIGAWGPDSRTTGMLESFLAEVGESVLRSVRAAKRNRAPAPALGRPGPDRIGKLAASQPGTADRRRHAFRAVRRPRADGRENRDAGQLRRSPRIIGAASQGERDSAAGDLVGLRALSPYAPSRDGAGRVRQRSDRHGQPLPLSRRSTGRRTDPRRSSMGQAPRPTDCGANHPARARARGRDGRGDRRSDGTGPASRSTTRGSSSATASGSSATDRSTTAGAKSVSHPRRPVGCPLGRSWSRRSL